MVVRAPSERALFSIRLGPARTNVTIKLRTISITKEMERTAPSLEKRLPL